MNTTYKNILVGVPPPWHEWYAGPTDALRRAAAMLSLAPGAHLTFLSVYSEVDTFGSNSDLNLLPADVLRKMNEDMRKDMEEKVGDYVKWFTANGVPCSVRVTEGRDAEKALISTAKGMKADLILIGYHHDEGLFDLFMPDVAGHLAKHAPCDVLLVSPKKK